MVHDPVSADKPSAPATPRYTLLAAGIVQHGLTPARGPLAPCDRDNYGDAVDATHLED